MTTIVFLDRSVFTCVQSRSPTSPLVSSTNQWSHLRHHCFGHSICSKCELRVAWTTSLRMCASQRLREDLGRLWAGRPVLRDLTAGFLELFSVSDRLPQCFRGKKKTVGLRPTQHLQGQALGQTPLGRVLRDNTVPPHPFVPEKRKNEPSHPT